MKTPSVLVVDDQPNNFDVVEALLSNQNYQLHYATSGESAIANLDAFDPDIILLDVMMPEMNGIEVCKRIKAMPKWQAVPIVMLTALNSHRDLSDCLAAGANDFISKPANGVELRARLNSMLRIKQQYDDLQGLLKLREDMIRMVVHDLRNPLSTILLGLELLEEIDYTPAQQQRKLGQINQAAEELHTLVDDFLQIALLESGNLRLQKTTFPLSDLLQSAVTSFEIIATQKEQQLELTEIAPGSMISGDANMLRRTIDNLLSNAIKFSPQQSQITVQTVQTQAQTIQIQVVDAGPGIADDMRDRIFDKYEVGRLMPNIAQIGLGLAFCKIVVEVHDGRIWVDNRESGGSIFTIELPMQDTDFL